MNRIEDISNKIIAYLKRYPDSADTLEGIAKWWIELEGIDQAVEEVAAAIELLLGEGVLMEIPYERKSSLYRLAESPDSNRANDIEPAKPGPHRDRNDR